MKKLYTSLFLLFFSASLFSQTTYVMGAASGVNGATANALNGSTVTIDCGTTNNFRDSGGSGANYGLNENITVTFCSNSGLPLYFDFRAASSSLNLDTGTGDTLFFFDATSGALIAMLTQSDDYAFSTPTVGTNSTCVRVVWRSNGAAVDGGWDGTISCVAAPSCASNPAPADVFLQAPVICNLNNYCGRTDTYYGEDAPYNFGGTGGGCPTPADGLFGGTLENNSWLAFQASSTSATFNFTVSGGGTCSGVQAGIFAFNTATTTFTRVSACAQSTGTGMNVGTSTLSATGLTIGDIYYIMMDGNAGSVCDYTISASSGVAVANAGPDQNVCGTATLAASGTGSWSVVSGTATFANPNSPTTTVTGLSANNTLRWTTTTIACGTATDDVVIGNNCPCSVIAISAGTQSACNPVSNTYSQQVTISFSNAPSSGDLIVNGQSFTIGTSPRTVTLTNLPANGAAVSVTASFSAQGGCSNTANALFTAPAACGSASCTPNNGTWD